MDFILSLLKDAVLTIIKVVLPDLVKHLLARLKERTAPTEHRDGSDSRRN